MKTVTSVMAIAFMAAASAVWAANPPASLTMIPPQINYQGRLVTPANVPYSNTTHTIDLSLYPSASTGTKLWSEQYKVQTFDGYFSVNLGSGGTGLLTSNPPIWQVLWKADAASPDNYFMALVVRTDANGANISSPMEASPRQQFMTAPFAYRAHQSVYATKADTLFDAPLGVQTPSLASTNGEVAVNSNMRVPVASTVYANTIRGHGASPRLNLYSAGGPIELGVKYLIDGGGVHVTDYASAIFVGSEPRYDLGDGGIVHGTDLQLAGKTVNITTTNFTMNSQPMFVRKTLTANAVTTSTSTVLAHNIDINEYDVSIAGFSYSLNSPGVRGVSVGVGVASISFTSNPTGGVVYIYLLGIRKGLSKNL